MVSFLLQLGDSIFYRSTNGCATRFAKSLSRLRFVSENSAKFPGWGCAINAKKIEVKFTQEVDKTEATKAANYTIVGLGATPVAAYDLKDDNKTLVITLTNPIANGTTFVVTVDEIQSKADADVKSPKFTKTISFSDTVKPALVDVKYPQAGVAVVNFTEELQTIGSVKVFADNKEVTLPVAPALTDDGKGIKFEGLEANKEYNVVILGAKDWSNNLINPNPLELKIKSEVVDNVKPVVSSVEAEGLKTLKVHFSKPVKKVSATAGQEYLKVTGAGITATGQVFDSKTNTVTVTLTTVTPGVVSVKVSDFKDLAGNDGVEFTKNVVFTDVVPTVSKTEVVKEGTDTFVKLTFNTAMTKDAAAAALAGKVVTPDNVEIPVTIPANAYVLDGTGADQDKIVKIKVTGLEAGKYELTIKKTDLTNLAKDLKVNFEIAATGDTTVPKVTGTPVITNKTVTVAYDSEMGQSALDVNNYTVSGQKVFEKAIFKNDKKTVELTLKEGAIKFDGTYELEISKSVKANNGVALKEAYSYAGAFKENVAPTISAVAFSGADSIVLTFSENVQTAAALTGFEVIVNNEKVNLGTVATVAGTETVTLKTQSNAPFVAPEDYATATVVVKVLDTNNITDANGNALKGGITLPVAK